MRKGPGEGALCILELGTRMALDWMWTLIEHGGGVGETQRDFDLSSREGSVQTERREGVNPSPVLGPGCRILAGSSLPWTSQ